MCPNDRYNNDEQICQAVTGMLAQIGIKVDLQARSKTLHFPKLQKKDSSFFLLGWGVMILGLRAWVYDRAPEGVRKSVVTGLLAWFVLDSTGSIASGNAWNAGYNVIVLLLAVGPLWRRATPSTTNG